jgi:hypothetical protein
MLVFPRLEAERLEAGGYGSQAGFAGQAHLEPPMDDKCLRLTV